MRVLIGGWPRSGKSTLAERIRVALGGVVRIRSTDEVMNLGWSEASAAVAQWLVESDAPGVAVDVVEGVAIARALRKWLAANPTGRPCDMVFWLREIKVESVPGQVAMGKGAETVWVAILPELLKRGVQVLDESMETTDSMLQALTGVVS